MPGPWSMADHFDLALSGRAASSSRPSCACRTRLVAQLRHHQGQPAGFALRPSRMPRASARGMPTRLADAAGVVHRETRVWTRAADHFHRVMLTQVPWPGADCDLELVHQPLAARQAQAHAAARGPAVGQRQADVGDARPLVLEVQAQAAPHAVGLHHFPAHDAAAAVDQRVARQLAGRRDHLGLVHQRELQLLGELAHLLPRWRRCRAPSDSGMLSSGFTGQAAPPCAPRASSCMPRSTLSAVRTPSSDRPSSTSVIATAGCMPTTTVVASRTRAMPEMLASMRPTNESTISSAEMSISTPLAPVFEMRVGQVVLQRQRRLVLHVHLDRDQQAAAHPQDRDAVHGVLRLADDAKARALQRQPTSASASVALVVMPCSSMPRCTMVCAICGRMPLMMQSAPISRIALTVFSRCCATSVSTVGTPVMSMMASVASGLDDALQQRFHDDLRAAAVQRADHGHRQHAFPQLDHGRGELQQLLLLAPDDFFAADLVRAHGLLGEDVTDRGDHADGGQQLLRVCFEAPLQRAEHGLLEGQHEVAGLAHGLPLRGARARQRRERALEIRPLRALHALRVGAGFQRARQRADDLGCLIVDAALERGVSQPQRRDPFVHDARRLLGQHRKQCFSFFFHGVPSSVVAAVSSRTCAPRGLGDSMFASYRKNVGQRPSPRAAPS